MQKPALVTMTYSALQDPNPAQLPSLISSGLEDTMKFLEVPLQRHQALQQISAFPQNVYFV